MIVVPVTHDLIHVATVHTARLPLSPTSLAQAPTAAPPTGGRSSAHGNRVGEVCRQNATQNRLARPPSMFNAQIRATIAAAERLSSAASTVSPSRRSRVRKVLSA